MYALEFETDISGQTLTLPAEVVSQIHAGQHARIILLLEEDTAKQSASLAVSPNPKKTPEEIKQLLAATRGSLPGSKSKEQIDREMRRMRDEWVREWE